MPVRGRQLRTLHGDGHASKARQAQRACDLGHLRRLGLCQLHLLATLFVLVLALLLVQALVAAAAVLIVIQQLLLVTLVTLLVLLLWVVEGGRSRQQHNSKRNATPTRLVHPLFVDLVCHGDGDR